LSNFKTFIKLVVSIIIWNLPSGKKRVINSFNDINYAKYLEKMDYDVIICTSPFYIENRILTYEAIRLGIPVLIAADGWDLFTCYYLGFKYKAVLVWGEYMKNHALLRKFSEKQIIMTGIPYAKKIIKNYNEINTQKAKEKYGIKNGEKTILFFFNGWWLNGNIEELTIDSILDAIEKKKLINTKLLFRLHPNPGRREEVYYRDKYKNNPNLIFQIPDISMDEAFRGVPKINQFYEVAEIFSVADVFINTFSMSLIEASIVGIQSILIHYDNQSTAKINYPFGYVKKCQIYKDLLSNGMPLAQNPDQLISYLDDVLNKGKTIMNPSEIIKKWNNVDYDVIGKIRNLIENEV
jgi:hypothetical protein